MSNENEKEVALEIAKLQSFQREKTSNVPPFELSSENTAPLIIANQDNYDPGNYDAIRLLSNAVVTISGFAGGIKGRTLLVMNVGGYTITFSHNSLSSLAPNRIFSSTSADISLTPNGIMRLYYDATFGKWRTNGN